MIRLANPKYERRNLRREESRRGVQVRKEIFSHAARKKENWWIALRESDDLDDWKNSHTTRLFVWLKCHLNDHEFSESNIRSAYFVMKLYNDMFKWISPKIKEKREIRTQLTKEIKWKAANRCKYKDIIIEKKVMKNIWRHRNTCVCYRF